MQPLEANYPCTWNDTTRKAFIVLCTITVALSIIGTALILKGTPLLTKEWCFGTIGAGLIAMTVLAVAICNKPKAKQLIEDKGQDKIYTHTLTLDHFDIEDFEKWLFKRADENKIALLKETVLKVAKEGKFPLTVTFDQIIPSRKAFDALLKQPIPDGYSFECSKNWFDFKDEGATYIDFANAFTFGGGWRDKKANVQEENLFYQFFELALAAYIAHKNGIEILPANGDPADKETLPTPFVFSNVVRRFHVSEDLYSAGLYQCKAKEIASKVTPLSNQVPVTIVGIAARDWRSTPVTDYYYSIDDLKYHFLAAYLAFTINPKAYTAPWGCGAFKNSDLMMTAIQLLAAKMAHVSPHFAGVNNTKFHPNYTPKIIDDLNKWVSGFNSPEAALDALWKQQDPKNNKLWKDFRPKA